MDPSGFIPSAADWTTRIIKKLFGVEVVGEWNFKDATYLLQALVATANWYGPDRFAKDLAAGGLKRIERYGPGEFGGAKNGAWTNLSEGANRIAFVGSLAKAYDSHFGEGGDYYDTASGLGDVSESFKWINTMAHEFVHVLQNVVDSEGRSPVYQPWIDNVGREIGGYERSDQKNNNLPNIWQHTEKISGGLDEMGNPVGDFGPRGPYYYVAHEFQAQFYAFLITDKNCARSFASQMRVTNVLFIRHMLHGNTP